MQSSEFASSNAPSLISSDLKIDGNLTCEGAIQIDGIVEGDINSHSLTIGETAEVSGVVTAQSVSVHGSMQGEIRSHTVQVMSTARFMGDIVHQVLSVESGAIMEGNIRRMESQPAAQAQVRPAAQPQPIQSAKAGKKAKMPAPNGAGEGDAVPPA